MGDIKAGQKTGQAQGPLEAYRQMKRDGLLKPDMQQELAVQKLQSLHVALRDYTPQQGLTGWKARLGLGRRRQTPPMGLYLFGTVGRGKSMLMDLFFDSAPVANKRRVHFHAFMTEVQDWLHRWRQENKGRKADPLPELAADLAEKTTLLCFDEFVVINIADAMILARLFETLFECGVVVVATSNFEPDRLYEGGLQRDRFLPFIGVMKERLDVLDLGAGTDYRLEHLVSTDVFHAPLDAAAETALEEAFAKLTDGYEIHPCSLTVKGREIPISAAAHGVARFTFDELCNQPLGAEDYLTLATHFHTVILSGVPKLSAEQRNEARRFMILVDALYEHRCNLVVSSEVEVEDLYGKGDGAYEFTRTVSRLVEMRSQDYIELPHLT